MYMYNKNLSIILANDKLFLSINTQLSTSILLFTRKNLFFLSNIAKNIKKAEYHWNKIKTLALPIRFHTQNPFRNTIRKLLAKERMQD